MFSEFEEKVIAALDDCTGVVRNCALNAVSHLRKASRLVEIDNEMAVFRAITAEEEAATALIRSLQAHKYRNAERLSVYSHTHKLGIYLVMDACIRHLFEFMNQPNSPFEGWVLNLETTGTRRALRLGMKVRGTKVLAHPQPPLHFVVTRSISGGYDVGQVLQGYLEKHDATEVKKHIEKIANKRNLLLYAGTSGVEEVEPDASRAFVVTQKQKVIRLLYALMLSDPWVSKDGKSGFLQQVLDSYLVLLDRLASDLATDPDEIADFNRRKVRAAPAPDAATPAASQSSAPPDH